MTPPDSFYSRLYRSKGRSAPLEPSHYKDVARQMRARWKDWLPADKDARILDLGCGCGEFVYSLRSMGYTRVEGVDSCAEELEHGRRMVPEGLVCADACGYLEGKEESFDLICAFNFFEHLERDQVVQTLDQARRALKPGGRILAITPNGLSPFSGATRYWDFTHQTSFTPASWRQIASVCGFREARFEECGPMLHSVPGAIRWCLWQVMRAGLAFVSLVEVGGARDPSHVYTADMKIILTK